MECKTAAQNSHWMLLGVLVVPLLQLSEPLDYVEMYECILTGKLRFYGGAAVEINDFRHTGLA